jgi:hypothetical protein
MNENELLYLFAPTNYFNEMSANNQEQLKTYNFK